MKKVKGFPNYTISESGKVYRDGKELTPYDNGQGYKQVKLFKDGKRYTKNVHRLVLESKEGSLGKNDTDHVNGNKGDNRLSNLQKLTHKENVKKIFK